MIKFAGPICHIKVVLQGSGKQRKKRSIWAHALRGPGGGRRDKNDFSRTGQSALRAAV